MTLSLFSILFGLLCIAVYGFAIKNPEGFQQQIRDFPRSEWPGRILTAISLPWAAYYLIITPPVAGNSMLTKLVMVLTPVAFVLVMKYLNELLSARALGGFLMLLATPMLQMARLHESSWSVVISVLAYIIAIKGMVLVLSPFRFRQSSEWLMAKPQMYRMAKIVGLDIGFGMLALGLLVY